MIFFTESYRLAFLGGLLIGVAALVLLFLNGRILGVSGIIGGLFNPSTRREPWRVFFLMGMLLGGLVLKTLLSFPLGNSLERPTPILILAGVLVGWGTRLGSGCTSGHGVCGMSRLSPRSLLGTVIFMLFGILTVWLLKLLPGGAV
ncbi:MAG: YeeE/YedE family protein [Proteobacteria bacterium]|nr:YeeE/YedE family protein [Pseudomonadota bacterium]NDC24337.1 YeeE/YedE family protein [Pseudomonadota bacterium]NDD04371.1 YeeE/YedE family protein [Pseudomonadota bacterium]NDG26000.1 YeeE/YedE family protein [Pseudomonadota bacterium]